jgi:hypothetical protein
LQFTIFVCSIQGLGSIFGITISDERTWSISSGESCLIIFYWLVALFSCKLITSTPLQYIVFGFVNLKARLILAFRLKKCGA